MKLLTFKDLRGKGISYTRQHIHKLVRRGQFPQPLKLVERGMNHWTEAEIDEFIENLAGKPTTHEGCYG